MSDDFDDRSAINSLLASIFPDAAFAARRLNRECIVKKATGKRPFKCRCEACQRVLDDLNKNETP
jgi:hypothetical protein